VQLPKTLAREIAGLHHLAYTPVTLHTPTADYARARRVIVIIIIQRRLALHCRPPCVAAHLQSSQARTLQRLIGHTRSSHLTAARHLLLQFDPAAYHATR
jgi:hypothetical protein